MNGPKVICFCGAEHFTGWCLRSSECGHRGDGGFVRGIDPAYEVCIDCGEARPSSATPQSAGDER